MVTFHERAELTEPFLSCLALWHVYRKRGSQLSCVQIFAGVRYGFCEPFGVHLLMKEAGFRHSAFTFANESQVVKSNINGSAVPPGALISYLQKGLLYQQIETHVNDVRIFFFFFFFIFPHFFHFKRG